MSADMGTALHIGGPRDGERETLQPGTPAIREVPATSVALGYDRLGRGRYLLLRLYDDSAVLLWVAP